MASSGWKALYAGAPWFRGPGRFPIPAYSEFVPPPRIGGKPYDGSDPPFFDTQDSYGWPVSESEQHIQLQPGLRPLHHHRDFRDRLAVRARCHHPHTRWRRARHYGRDSSRRRACVGNLSAGEQCDDERRRQSGEEDHAAKQGRQHRRDGRAAVTLGQDISGGSSGNSNRKARHASISPWLIFP